MEFLNKTVIVTGAASGMGLLASQCFAKEGANILMCDVNMPVLEENAFAGLTAEATYPYGNGTWQPERLSACGGSISWLEKGRIIAEGTSAYSLRWQVEANGVLTISGEGEMGNYFPSLGEPAPWYAFADKFSCVVVEDGITSIGYSAFKNCAGIREIRLPESLTKIGGSAFAGCTALETINLADSIAQIGAYVMIFPSWE